MLSRLYGSMFIGGVIVGFVCIYIIQKKTRTIFVYPTEENKDTIQYKDPAGICFKPVSKTVECPKNAANIEQQPPQE